MFDAALNLNEYRGAKIQVRFVFDSVDNVSNQFEGWYVDDVRVMTSPVALTAGDAGEINFLNAGFGGAYGGASYDDFTVTNTKGDVIPFDPSNPATAEDVDGLWHLTQRRATDGIHSSSFSFYYGKETLGNYNVGRSAGILTSPEIDLSNATTLENVFLSFNYLLQTENSPTRDNAIVQIKQASESDWTDLARLTDKATWTTVTGDPTAVSEATTVADAALNLNAYRGKIIQVRFVFDSVDNLLNQFEGWYVDDVQVTGASSFDSEASGDLFGASVTGLGDINDDGNDDIAVLRGHGCISSRKNLYRARCCNCGRWLNRRFSLNHAHGCKRAKRILALGSGRRQR